MSGNESGPANEISGLAHGAGRRSISGLSLIRLILLPYLDPGSGSFLIQILIAAVLGRICFSGAVVPQGSGDLSTVVRGELVQRVAPEAPDLGEVDGQNRKRFGRCRGTMKL